MTFEPHDWLLLTAGAVLWASLLIYCGSRWLYYERRQRAERYADQEKAALPPLDYSRMRPRDPRVRLATLPEAKECEMRRLARVEAEARAAQQNERRSKLVISGSSRIR